MFLYVQVHMYVQVCKQHVCALSMWNPEDNCSVSVHQSILFLRVSLIGLEHARWVRLAIAGPRDLLSLSPGTAIPGTCCHAQGFCVLM